MRTITVRVPDEVAERLARLARATGHPKSHHVRAALDEYLAELEDIVIAQQRDEELRTGKVEPLSLEEVEQHFGTASSKERTRRGYALL